MEDKQQHTPETAEKILREYVSFEDVNGSECVMLLPLTIVDAMEEYSDSQSKAKDDRIRNLEAIIGGALHSYNEVGYISANDVRSFISVLSKEITSPEKKQEPERKVI